MTWAKTHTNPKYHTREHRALRAALVRRLTAGEPLDCMATVCLFGRAPITNPNGNDPDGLHLGHHDDGLTYRGPEHRECNVKDGARRGNQRSQGKPTRRWVL